MKKIFLDILLTILIMTVVILSVIFLFYSLIPDQYETNYVEVMWDKYQRLNSIDEPKIVLIGDSNLAFGINSELVQNEIGMPVVNMGLHGGLGNDVQTRLAMTNVNKDDLYIICYTDYAQTDDISQKDLTLIMLSRHKELWNTLSIKQKIELLPGIPDYMFNSISFYISGRGNEPLQDIYLDYARCSFNEFGDNTVRIPENDYFDLEDVESEIGSISEETIRMIRYWKEYCDERGAKLVIAGYPIVRTSNMPAKEDFDEFGIMLEKKTGCNTISQFSDYIIEPELLYDSLYHLTLEGADYRSELLAKDIKRYLNQ